MLVFFNDPATTEIYTLSLHDALPIFTPASGSQVLGNTIAKTAATGWANQVAHGDHPLFGSAMVQFRFDDPNAAGKWQQAGLSRSEEHTSELQSRQYLVCRLLLEKKNT